MMTRTRRIQRSCLALLTLSALAVAASVSTAEPADVAAPVDMKSKLQAGETFRYSIRSRQVRQHQKPDETIVKWITRRSLTVSCEVLEPNPEIGPRVRLTIDDLNCTLLNPSKALRFTSENEHMNTVGSAMTLAMEPIVGAALTFTLDERGTIRTVEGADRLLKEKELRKYAQHIVGDEAIEQMIQPLFHSIAQPSDGDDDKQPWTSVRVLEFPEFATLTFDERWELRKRRAGRATFRVDSVAEAEISEDWPKAFLADSRTIGAYTWDELAGRLHHTEINRFYVIDLENDPDGPSIAGEEVLTISAPIGDN